MSSDDDAADASEGDAEWNALVAAALGDACCGAAVCDARDGRVWGATADFGPRTYTAEIGDDETARVNEADIVRAAAAGARHKHGLRIDEKKYMVLRMENGVCYGKAPRAGCCLAATKEGTCVVVGAFDEDAGQSAGRCNVAVERLAKYLGEQGF
mmetsp:Transcript_14361/g.44417  ORF Transcript_14361/g.44417 Transcript_14361/m.44417 type:complete len:155 (-) Transcript_14361:74-538(-)